MTALIFDKRALSLQARSHDAPHPEGCGKVSFHSEICRGVVVRALKGEEWLPRYDPFARRVSKTCRFSA
ncbi:hypothetical protein [Oryzifoliimicrobium ureilyticus]|uniref:hypothetical protein n=1 Tax=Oryzifoliimicrobium ureilyticus TaxID=3113724 RepID=UPI0030761977